MVVTAPRTKEIEHGPNSLIQELFLSSEVDEVGGFGKKGWGKTWTVSFECLRDIEQPDFSALVLRATSTDFEDMWNKARLLFAGYNPDVNETKHLFTFPIGARVKFAHLQHPKDIFTYNGQEYQLIIFDELPQFPLMPYLFMFSCLRGTNPRIRKRMRATGNPFGQGMAGVKARFFDKLKPTRVIGGKEIVRGEIGWFKTDNNKDVRASADIERVLFDLVRQHPADWRELKARDPALREYLSREWYFGERSDNVDLMKADPDYEARLEQLPEKMKRAYKDGLFEYQDNEDQLIKSEWWDAAVTGKNPYKPGHKAFGLDYAEGFGDKSVDVEGEGNRPTKVLEWDFTPHPAMAAIVQDEIFSVHGKLNIRGGLDSVGTGAGVYTSLAALDIELAERVDPIRYRDPEFDKKYDEAIIKYHFKTIQDQILWQLREDFQNGNIELSLIAGAARVMGAGNYYENIELLKEEVLAFWFRENGGDIWICGTPDLRKTQRTLPNGMTVPCLGRSPDRAKALAIWNWVRNRPPGGVGNKLLDKTKDYGYRARRSPPKPDPRRLTI